MKGKLLVVDDDRHMVKTLCDIFRLRGWDVTGVNTGEAAIAAVEQQHFTLVLMDIKMPGLSGVEALQRIRKLRPSARVVLMTAYTAGELIEEAFRKGALEVLPKPVPMPKLMQMTEALAGARKPVLLVDDDPVFLKTTSDVLRAHGFAVVEAQNIDDALQIMSSQDPCIVALDLVLNVNKPKDSIIAIHEMNPAAVLILFSGHSALLDESVREIPSQWVYARLEKPFSPDLLIKLIDERC